MRNDHDSTHDIMLQMSDEGCNFYTQYYFYHLNCKLKIEKSVHNKFPCREKQHILPLAKALTVNVWHSCLINDLNKWSSKCSALAFSIKSSCQHWPIPAIITGKDVEISWRHTVYYTIQWTSVSHDDTEASCWVAHRKEQWLVSCLTSGYRLHFPRLLMVSFRWLKQDVTSQTPANMALCHILPKHPRVYMTVYCWAEQEKNQHFLLHIAETDN